MKYFFQKGVERMARTVSTVDGYKKETIKHMKALGTYKVEYNPLIDVYSDLLYQYNKGMKEFAATGYQYETETASGGTKKSGLVSAMEVLRKDIGTYSDRLRLNPQRMQDEAKKETETNPLAQFLSQQGKK